MSLTTLIVAFVLATTGPAVDERNIIHGVEIPSEGYCDQPYIVMNDLGEWVCTLTTGPGEEGNDRQHVVATISADKGETWGPLIDIEPQGPPEASWVMPLKVGGRIYAFYDYNGDNMREVKLSNGGTTKRVDTLGHYVFKYSDDGGHTWSDRRYRIPIRAFDIDRENVYGGEVQFFWGVGKPIIHGGAAYIGVSKVGNFGKGFIERSEGIFLKSDNILTEWDPEKIRWETLPDGDIGLRAPQGPIAEEHNLTPLSDGSLYCTYRTIDGHPCHAYSRDGGHTWTGPEYLTYTPSGRQVKHPRAANFVRRFSNGKYLYWFHNHGGQSYEGRNPVWMCGGIEQDGFIHWSQPEIVLYDDTPPTRMSYPDFVELDGEFYATETQKSTARVHRLDRTLLEGMWNQHRNKTVAKDGLVLHATAENTKPGSEIAMAQLPILEPGGGFTVDLWLDMKGVITAQTLFETATGDGAGIAVALTPEGSVQLTASDGANTQTFASDAGVLTEQGLHYVAVILDGGPRIVTFVVDGILCDGGDRAAQGWHRIDPALIDCNGSTSIRFAGMSGVSVESLRIYGRYLRTSEAVGNWRAGMNGSEPEGEAYDVVVYGGTAGGAITAIAAANEGLDVLLVEPGSHIGGMVSGGLGRTDYGNQAVIGGMSRHFFERLGEHYGEAIAWFFEPHVAEAEFRKWLDEAGVKVVFGQRIDSVDKDGTTVTAMVMHDGTVYRGKVFADCSYEGDLMHRAGVLYTWGRESQTDYGETLAGRIERSPKHQFPGPVNPYDVNGDPLPFIYRGPAGAPGQGDRKVQAYNFRLCLTNRAENRLPYPKPADYDPARYELLKRYLAAYPGLTMDKVMIPSPMPEAKTDVNNNGAFSTDYIGGSWEYPEADYKRRAEIWDETLGYIQGFLYFLANDPSVPEPLQQEINEWGPSADEFQDTDHWPHQMYVREARRMVGEYVMQQRDLQSEREKDDSIGMGSYNSDSHHVQRIVAGPDDFPGDEPSAINEGDMQVSVQPYEISYRALVPKRDQATNLLVPVCCSASHVAYSSIRMEPQYMIMGHASGVAAALAIRDGVPVQNVPIAELQAKLREQKQILALDEALAPFVKASDLDGIVVDNPQAETIGEWRRSTSIGPYVGFDYIHQFDESTQEDARLRYVPKLPKAGKYEVRFSYTANPNRATNVPVTIHTADGQVAVTVNERTEPGELAPFISLGVYSFAGTNDGVVEVDTKGADGYVVGDAVQWIPVE